MGFMKSKMMSSTSELMLFLVLFSFGRYHSNFLQLM